MIWDMRARLAGAGLGLLLIYGSLGAYASIQGSCEAKHETKASEAKGRADGHAEAGGNADAAAEQAGQRAAVAEVEVDRLRRELDRLKRTPKPAPVVPGPDPGTAGLVVVDLAPVVAKQDELISAQGVQIQALKAETLTLSLARDEWKAAFHAERDRATGLYLALEAQKSMTKAALWRGRFQGVAVGFAAGYVSGRLH